MKKIVLAFIAIVSIFSFVHAQSDTLYIMKAGVVVDKFDVNTQVDSVIFYKPTPMVKSSDTITDYDGNLYKTLIIGTQVWMAENLKTTHYADGTAIPFVSTIATWDSLTSTSKAYCWYNDDIANKATYGALYTWAAAVNGVAGVMANPSGIQGVCPVGWHLPSHFEWMQMETYLATNGYNHNGTFDAPSGGEGGKLAKSLASTSGWESSSFPGSPGNTTFFSTYCNKSGFTALPVGSRLNSGVFTIFGYKSNWWTASETIKGLGMYRCMINNMPGIYNYSIDKETGFSVRCVKD